MTEPDPAAEVLTDDECWELLRRTALGRLAVIEQGVLAIYPINYLVDSTSLVFRTRTDSKIAAAPALERVAFEIDGYDAATSRPWSVVVKGAARFVESERELAQIARLGDVAWAVADRAAWVRVVPNEVTGRSFEVLHGSITPGSVGWSGHEGDAGAGSAASPGAES